MRETTTHRPDDGEYFYDSGQGRYDDDADADDYRSDDDSSSYDDDEGSYDDRSYDDDDDNDFEDEDDYDDAGSCDDEERGRSVVYDDDDAEHDDDDDYHGRRPLLRARSSAANGSTTTFPNRNASAALFSTSSSVTKAVRSLRSRRLDLRSTANAAVLTCALFTAVRLAGTELSSLEERGGRGVAGTSSSSSSFYATDFDPLLYTPSPETRSRLSEELSDPDFFEVGESNARDRTAFLLRQHTAGSMAGVDRFEYGEFSGVAATPDQYVRAREHQAKLRDDFRRWVDRTAPEHYYDKTAPVTAKKTTTTTDEAVAGMVVAAGVVDGDDLEIASLEGYKDVWEPFDPTTDTPVFFHIPKAGGTTIKNVIGTCHRVTLATEVGVMNGHDRDTDIAVVRPYANVAEGKEGTAFVNVDTTTEAGIDRARRMGLAESGLADVIITPLVHEAEVIFSPNARGRVFTLFRHPLDRALSMFYYIQVADWEPTYKPELADMTVEEYVTSTYVENNWAVRRLANVDRSVRLEQKHLAAAMDVARRKFLVGLLERKEESLERFEKFFGWTFVVKPDNQERCRASLLNQGANQNLHADLPAEGTEAHDALIFHNRWDLLLYEYVEGLFEQQAAFVEGVPDNFRMMDATCAKCVPPTFPEVLL